MRKPYRTYAEIPLMIQDYVLTVANEKRIMDVPLEDINSFIDGLHQYHEMKPELEEDGWVL